MKFRLSYLILLSLLGITVFTSIAQQNQNVPKTNTEVENLKKRVSELEDKLRTVENVEKMELAAKLAEAQAKLNNTDIDKLKGELRESNNDWLRAWNNWFVGIVSVIAVIIGAALWLVLKTLIEKGIEKRLDGFKESVEKVSLLEDQIKILEKEHAVSMLDGFMYGVTKDLSRQPEPIKSLSEDVLLEVFSDKTLNMAIRMNTIEVLAARESPLLISTVLNFLNSIINSDINWGGTLVTRQFPRRLLDSLRTMHNEEAYQGVIYFLNRLIKENPRNKGLFLPPTVFALAKFGIEMRVNDWVVMLRKVIPDLIALKPNDIELIALAKDFDKSNEPEGIREILEHIDAEEYPNVKDSCLELLEKYNSNHTEGESNESKPTN